MGHPSALKRGGMLLNARHMNGASSLGSLHSVARGTSLPVRVREYWYQFLCAVLIHLYEGCPVSCSAPTCARYKLEVRGASATVLACLAED